jgi:glycosyltransferase involved in cell wall biosynthesis
MQKGKISVANNVEVYSVGKERGFSEPKRILWFYRHLFHILRKDKIDVCFSHMMPKFTILAAPVLKVNKIPMVLWYAHKAITNILKLAHFLVNKVITASPESFRIKSKKVIVTGHGIDTKLFTPPQERSNKNEIRILTVGRLSPIKNYGTLISAINLMVKEEEIKNNRVKIVGGTPEGKNDNYEISLKEQVKHLNFSDHINFVGSVPFRETVRYYQKGDIFINLSDTDSIDKAILEAMACGCIPITSNRSFAAVFGKFREILMVPKGNAKLLAEKIQSISRMPNSEKNELRKSLRQIVIDNHSLDKLSERLMRVFDDINTGNGDC